MLRFAQHDNSLPILLVNIHYRANVMILHLQGAINRAATRF
jgi:hypothetical protein